MKEAKRVDGVRVLSVKQPFAWAIITGRKRVENRVWTTEYRGPVLIHAGATVFGQDEFDWLRDAVHLVAPRRADIDRGCIVGVADLVDVVTRRRAKRFGPWFSGPYGLVFQNAVSLKKPIRLKSQLGLYRPTPALLARVNAQLPAKRKIRVTGR